jgi:hypothetical protein
MPRSRTPSKRTSSKKKASAGPVDLNDPIVNCAVTAGSLIAFGCLGHLSGGDALKYNHLGGFAEPGYAGAVFGVFGSDHNLHARWAATLVTTLHLINSVGSNGGYWANDIVGCVFNAFGSGMMAAWLAGTPVGDWGIWAHMPMVIFLWYIVNHNIPKTDFNVWDLISENVSKFLPLQRIMDLCTLHFNCSVLFAACAVGAGEDWNFMPNLSKVMFFAVATHCSSDFFNQGGFSFNLKGCSATCERAVIVAFWMATAGMSTLPFVGSFIGQVTGPLAAQFGGHQEFLWACILGNELFGAFVPVKPHTMVQDFLTKLLL